MKKHFLSLVLIAFSFPLLPHNVNGRVSASMEKAEKSSRINLKGGLSKGGFRSGTDPIVVAQQSNALFVRFQKELGVLQVTITGTQGQVYATSVKTATQSAITIPSTGMPAGNYTILFANEHGMMWGEFTL